MVKLIITSYYGEKKATTTETFKAKHEAIKFAKHFDGMSDKILWSLREKNVCFIEDAGVTYKMEIFTDERDYRTKLEQ